jgi:hypothetical protein
MGSGRRRSRAGDTRIDQLQLRWIEWILHREQRRENREQEEHKRHGGRDHGELGAAE